MKAPSPPDETQRLEALRQFDVLDTLPEQAFDDLTLLAAHICQVPMALVSLVDDKRQWFKSKIGVTAAETSRDVAFCAHTILDKDHVLEVRDAETDPRFADSTLVTSDPHIRFYAGAPLVTHDGHALGALCVMDRQPRTLTPDQLAALQALSRNVVAQLELRQYSQKLTKEFAGRQRIEGQLRQQFDQMAVSEQKTAGMLALAERSRRALLSVLEDDKHATQNLRESEERFRQLADNIQEVFWMTNLTMTEILYVSPAYETIWGRTCKSLYESPLQWITAIHPDDRKRVEESALNQMIQGKYDETYRILRPDGSVRWIRDRGFPIRDPKGQVYRIVGTAADITREHRLEEQFRQAQKMEAMGTLAGGIAHDFNNILAAMNGYAELAKMSLGDGNKRVSECLDSVLQAGGRAVNLVRQILTFSRQQEQPQRRAVQLRAVVEETLKLLRATIPTTIEFKTTFAPGLPAILADSSQIHQILMNLGTNAWHAMRNKTGCLSVTLDDFEADAAAIEAQPRLRARHYVRLSLGDTGSGMDKATMEHIFEPFFTTKAPGEGTGLGLSVVHGIMESHEGLITVYSQPGLGTTFHLYFPAHLGEASKAPQAAGLIPTGAGGKILYVDDEEPLARLGQKTLEQLGYQVEMRTNVMEALELVRTDPARFDLVITDQTMPNLTGVDFARQLQAIRPGLPILLTSGYSANLTPDLLKAAGIVELLLKPQTIHSLATAVHRALAPPSSK